MLLALAWLAGALLLPTQSGPERGFLPGQRVLLDAHNAYPEEGKWRDRIDRALSTRIPLAIEQDLCWYQEPHTGRSWSVVAHGEPLTGQEPTLRSYFFERIRPLVEKELRGGDPSLWPVLVLNLDFKEQGDHEAHHREIWELLGEYESWLCTAERGEDDTPRPLEVGPLLVLTGASLRQEKTFYQAVPPGGRLRLFGAVQVESSDPTAPPQQMVPGSATNYRRWWNNPWKVVEPEGQTQASSWTAEKEARLNELVRHAHDRGLWIRFYTLNGHPAEQSLGWNSGYNFGSLDRVRLRWQAALRAGVDFLATDQYEEFSALHSLLRSGN